MSDSEGGFGKNVWGTYQLSPQGGLTAQELGGGRGPAAGEFHLLCLKALLLIACSPARSPRCCKSLPWPL